MSWKTPKERIEAVLLLRDITHAHNEGIQAKFRAAIYKRFGHPHCEESLYNGEFIELHHKIAQKSGGKWSMDNIKPLHRVCHQSVTHDKRGGLKKKND